MFLFVDKCDDRKQTVDLGKGVNLQLHIEPLCIYRPVTCNKTELETDSVSKTVEKINKCSICNITSEVEVPELLEVMEKEDYVSQDNVEPQSLKIWQISTSIDYIENEEYETPG